MESPQRLSHYGHGHDHDHGHNHSRMAIDSLLNPSESPDTRPRLYSSSHSQLSPRFPPSPTTSSGTPTTQYFYPQYHNNYHHHRPFNHYPYSPRSPRSPTSTTNPSSYSQPRDRHDSVSSSSSTNTDKRRPPRPKYEEEEMYFIWYHRVDLNQEWKEVRESFNRQFPSRQRSGFQGIQCKFYRFIREKNCPTLREQRRMRDGEFLREGATLQDSRSPKFGVVEWTGVRYPWMRDGKDQSQVHRRISA